MRLVNGRRASEQADFLGRSETRIPRIGWRNRATRPGLEVLGASGEANALPKKAQRRLPTRRISDRGQTLTSQYFVEAI